MVKTIGRKIDILKIDGFYPIDIKFVSESSKFIAKFLGKDFINKDLNLLKEELKAEAGERAKTIWKPVLKLDLSRWTSERHAAGFSMEKKMLGTTILPDGRVKKVLCDVVSTGSGELDAKNWKASTDQWDWKGENEDTKLIDYTPERYKSLKLIEERMTELKEQLRFILKGNDVSKFLSALNESGNAFLKDDFSKPKQLQQGTE